MISTQSIYPIFEANQVLTSDHLNNAFNYLDEQERLTRANLIGIGIVCGLEIQLNGTMIHLSKGCGITSEGYVIIEPEDVNLSYKADYKVPRLLDGTEYEPFYDKKNNNKQFPLWELFPKKETDAAPLDEEFLKDKAVMLYLELKKANLRNCSPNNCNDKGSEVTATVRRILINIKDLKNIIANANKLGTDLTSNDFERVLLARLNLPDLRLPRYDVPNTSPVTSHGKFVLFELKANIVELN